MKYVLIFLKTVFEYKITFEICVLLLRFCSQNAGLKCSF